jgi:hypothetical protein
MKRNPAPSGTDGLFTRPSGFISGQDTGDRNIGGSLRNILPFFLRKIGQGDFFKDAVRPGGNLPPPEMD